MRTLVSIGISCGILCGLMVQFSGQLGLIPWVVIAAWACYYAAGGKKEALLKIIPANLSGVIWAYLIVLVATNWAFTYALGIAVAIAVIMMCVQAKLSLLAFIPGAFIGAACAFGSGYDWKGTAIALIIGAIIGFISEQGAGLVGKLFPEKAA